MSKQLNTLLAEDAAALVYESFTGVEGKWWWERRLGGGLAVCQELDPEALSRRIADRTGRPLADVRSAIQETLDLEDLQPVVLTFEVPGESTAGEAARLLKDRSSEPEGLAAGIRRSVEEFLGQ